MIDYILKSLQQEDHVFIERLGAFRTQLKHAVIEKNVIRPPYNEVVFLQNDSEENNFALANQISREKKCLFTEANEMIMRWVDELLAALQNNKSVTYEGFGTFMLDKKGNISFESAVVPQLNSQFEGMEPIDLKGDEAMKDDEAMNVEEPIVVPEPEPVVEPEPVGANNNSPVDEAMKDDEVMKDDEAMKVEEPIVVPEPEPVAEPEPVGTDNDSPVDEAMKDDEAMNVEEPIVVPEPEPVAEPEPVGANNDSPDDDDEDDDDEDEEEDDEKKRHGLAWLWILLLLLLVLGALGYVFKDRIWSCYQQWKDKKHPVEQEVVPEVTDIENQTAVFGEEPIVEEDAVAEEAPEVVEEPVPEPVAPAPVKSTSDGKYNYIRFEQGRYYVIVGSFPTESDVEKHIRNKKLGQYSPVIVKQDGVKNLRVCIGVFDTEAAAEQFGKTTNQNYWVLK